MTETDAERELLKRLARGDMEALGRLYDSHSAQVYHLLLAQGLRRSEAEDALQEVFLALVERGRGLTRIEKALPYLLGIARHKASRYRSQRRRAPEALEEEQEAEGPDLSESLTVRETLRQLPAEQAEVVALKVWHEMTFAEIAGALNISPNTAASRYRYGLDKLRVIWGGKDDDGRGDGIEAGQGIPARSAP